MLISWRWDYTYPQVHTFKLSWYDTCASISDVHGDHSTGKREEYNYSINNCWDRLVSLEIQFFDQSPLSQENRSEESTSIVRPAVFGENVYVQRVHTP